MSTAIEPTTNCYKTQEPGDQWLGCGKPRIPGFWLPVVGLPGGAQTQQVASCNLHGHTFREWVFGCLLSSVTQ